MENNNKNSLKHKIKRIKEYRDSKKKNKNEKLERYKRELVKGNRLLGIFITAFVLLSISTVFTVIYAEKVGLSQEEIDEKSELMEMKYESIAKGHLGGANRLIEDKYEKEISKEEFEKFKEKDGVFVYFYSPYCPKCENVGDNIIEVLDNESDKYRVVDANDDKKFQQEENVGEVPKIVYYEKGNVEGEIKGEKEFEEYREFVKEYEDK